MTVNDLADAVPVGEADNKAVLWGVVLGLVLHDQAFAGVVVGLPLAAAAVLDLVALEVRLVLLYFYEWHVVVLVLISLFISRMCCSLAMDGSALFQCREREKRERRRRRREESIMGKECCIV